MQAKARALMTRVEYQLRPPDRTSMSSCLRCGRPSPGGQLCADCLCDDLAALINNVGAARRWLQSMKVATQDAGTVLAYAAADDGSPAPRAP